VPEQPKKAAPAEFSNQTFCPQYHRD